MIGVLKKQLASDISEITNLETDKVYTLLENPKSIEHGHLAFPVFFLAKELKKAPPVIAKDLQEKMEGKFPNVKKVEAAGGYINFTYDLIYLQNLLSQSVKASTPTKPLGYKEKKGERVVIDYSSPNVAKPMSIGHLRATVIGQAIRNLAESQGYDVTGLNYLGDWGVQFGKLAYAFTEWEGKKDYDFEGKPFESLFQLYVDFHAASKDNPELEQKGSLTFRRLEEGDKEVQKIWKMFLDISLKEYKRIYGMLNVHFDLIQGESFYNDKLEPTVALIKSKGLLQESDGAQVVFLEEEEMPPCIIKKSDGASLYATRDIASAIHRHDGLKGDHLLYVVGVDQNLHFKQVFKVLEKMGYEWSANCHHVSFGMYRFKDIGKMSTRRGNVIFMDDVLGKSIELAEKIIEEKNPSLENKKQIAQQIGIGAIIFNDLSSDRVKNVDFDWDRVLDFEGDSGPYVQYSVVRCRSILKKFGKEIAADSSVAMESPEEKSLVKQLLLYPEALATSYRTFKPSFLAQYLLELCRAFGSFYSHHKILDDQLDERTKMARLRLVQCTETVLTAGLGILGIQAPDKM